MGCNNSANYQVQVCNSGSAGADIQSMNLLPPAGFVLQQEQMQYNPSSCSGLVANTQRVWGTYFGGTTSDIISDMAIDASGNIYVTGETPVIQGSLQQVHSTIAHNGGTDGFVAKFNPNGVLLWGTYFGGTGADYGKKIAVDNNGDVYVAGYSSSSDGIGSAGAFQTAMEVTEDAILMKFIGTTGTRLWGTYYGDAGGSASEDYAMVAVSGTDVYLAMKTTFGGGAPLTTNGTAHIGSIDIILAKFNSNGGRIWATVWGGPSQENIVDADLVANASSVYLSGTTTSSSGIASGNSWNNTYPGSGPGFLARFNPANGNVHWATYVVGSGVNRVYALVLEGPDKVLAAARQQLLRFSETGGAPLASSTNIFYPTGITTDAAGNIYVLGSHFSWKYSYADG